MRENTIRELQALGFVDVRHIGGDCNLSDIYTKENKDINHFVQCRDATMACPIYSLLSVQMRLSLRGLFGAIALLPVEQYYLFLLDFSNATM